jgi:uroporphyrinogen decarboxylase
MNSRDRVRCSLNHEQPDRVPIEFGGAVTSFTYGSYNRMIKHFGIEDSKAKVGAFKVMENVDEEILEKLQSDFRFVFFSPEGEEWKNKVIDDKHFYDFWGIKFGDVGDYYEMIENPMRNFSVYDLETYTWPDFSKKENYKGLREKAESLYKNTNYSLVGNCAINLLERSEWLRGLDQFLVDLMVDEEFATALLDKLLQSAKDYLDNYLDEVGDFIDVICLGDDLATQDRLFMSPAVYRKLIKPRYSELCSYTKKKTKAKIFHHSCGAVYPFINDLIECGVDILNPVQPRAAGMDRERLKREFGNRISFWGGIDIQYVLPKGSKEEIIREVEYAVKTLGKDGGFIMGPAHNVQSDVNPENLLLMVDTAIHTKI